jgi:hypothetical protein
MADGPLDYGNGYNFESQKGISDRRAAAGFPPGPDGSTDRVNGSRTASSGSGSGWVEAIIYGVGMILWWSLKATGFVLLHLLDMIFSGGKRRGRRRR